MSKRIVHVALLATLLCGCVLGVSRDEYASYRRYRMADAPSSRLDAGREYLDAHPDGFYADEVRSAMRLREESVYASRSGSEEGLNAYLRLYPNGEYSERAREELAALAERAARDRQALEASRVRDDAAAAEMLRARREWVRDRLRDLLVPLLSIRTWGDEMEVIVARYPELDRAFSTAPRPVCDEQTCVKHLSLRYQVSGFEGPVTRSVEVVARLELRDERLVGASLWMPGFGLSRWFELEHREAVDDADEEARHRALAWALAEVEGLLRDHLTAGEPAPEPLAATPGHPLLSLRVEARTGEGEASGQGIQVDLVVAAEGDDPDLLGDAFAADGFVVGPAARTEP